MKGRARSGSVPDVPNDDAVRARLRDSVGAYRLSLAARDLVTGASLTYRPDGRFITASVAKIAVLVVQLVRSQAAGREPTERERALAREMITVSDNDAAHELWRVNGRDAAMAEVNADLGLTETVTTPESWGLTRTSAADQVRLVSWLAGTAEPPVLDRRWRAYVLELMAAVTPEQRWGIGAVARPGDAVALKNGWLDYSGDDGRWTVNTVGRVTGGGRDLVMAVLSNDHADLDDGVAAVEKAAAIGAEALRAAGSG